MGGSNHQTNDQNLVDYSPKAPLPMPLKDNEGNLMTDVEGNVRYAPMEKVVPIETGKSMPEDNTLHAIPTPVATPSPLPAGVKTSHGKGSMNYYKPSAQGPVPVKKDGSPLAMNNDLPNAYGREATPKMLSSEDAIEQALTKAEQTA